MSIQVWSIGLQKLTKIIENHVHIRSTDHFKQVGVRGKITEMKSIVWMYGVHSLPKLHSPTYYPIMRYQYYILQHAWSIRLLNVPLCNIIGAWNQEVVLGQAV